MWTNKHKRTAYDTVVAEARGGMPKAWAKLYKMGQINSFSIARYGEHADGRLALEVVRRMDHFYDKYLEEDEAIYQYSENELNSYDESEAWVNSMLENMEPGREHVWDRGQEVMRLVPVNP